MNAASSGFEVGEERDLARARQLTRAVAARLGFNGRDRARIVAAVSMAALGATRHAGGARVEFRFEGDPGQALEIRVVDRATAGAGGQARDLDEARGMVDAFEVGPSEGGGLAVLMAWALPPGSSPDAAVVAGELARLDPVGPIDEIARQDRELIAALDQVRDGEAELARAQHDLERAGRGIRALGLELDQRATLLRQAAATKARFFSHMSHELRTPLSSILGLARLLLDRSDGDLTAEQERQVGFILLAAHDLNGMVDDLFDLARIEAGREPVRVDEVNIPLLFDSLRSEIDPLRSPGSPVALLFEQAEALPTISTDLAKLSKVLQNFLSNALKFTERGEVRVRVEPGPGGSVVFSVSDTGIGIEPGHLESIFEEFAQVDGPLQRLVKGSGLGLPLVKKLAQLLGGHVEVRSRPGVGSTFSLTIPSRHPSAVEAHPQEIDRA